MTQRVYRMDRAPMEKAMRLDSGAIRAPVRLTRVGVFTYHDPNTGATWRELRRPEEVFKADALKTFELVPVINDHHPESQNGRISTSNATRFAVGAVAHVCQDKEDPNYLSALITVWDKPTIDQVDAGKQEVSNGYYADRVKAEPGAIWHDSVTGTDLPYDYEQKNIRGNHVAIVAAGRAGPGARILLDGKDAAAIQDNGDEPQKENKTMEKITLDGVTFEVTTQVKEAVSKLIAANEAQAKKISLDADTVRGERDGLKGQVEKLTTELAAAKDPKVLAALVSDRLEVVKLAEEHGFKADGLDLPGVQKLVIAKLDPSIKLDNENAGYIAGVFSMLNKATAKNPAEKFGSRVVTADNAGPKNNAQEYRTSFFTPREQK